MQGLIGGSGSTGSSVLRQMLNRHPDFYCINESSIFCKKALYINWEINKHRIFKKGLRGLRSAGFHIFNGVDISRVEMGPSEELLADWIVESPDFKSFASQVAKYYKKQSWATFIYEKTPGNAATLTDFTNAFTTSKSIVCLRNPTDTIASLVARGFDPYYASAQYLYNTSYALSAKARTLHCRYEDLIDQTSKTLYEVQRFIGLEPVDLSEIKKAVDTSSDEITKIDSWAFDETQNIQQSKKSKYESLSSSLQEQIVTAIHHLRIKEGYAKENKLEYSSIVELAAACQYSMPKKMSNGSVSLLKKNRDKDIMTRTLRAYPLHLFNYPIDIDEQ